MDDLKYESLKLKNQLCFPLYAASKEVVKKYRPHLDALDLTYTQYITMMALWEKNDLNVKNLGKRLFLDSGTLTPVLKSLEQKGYVTRTRSKEDERVVLVSVSPQGETLKDSALRVPPAVATCIGLAPEEALELHRLLHKLLGDTEDE